MWDSGIDIDTYYLNYQADHVDLIMGSMEYAISSVGGFCVGSSYVVDHQRLSGQGYCFSASLPPMLAAAAITAIDTMEKQTDMFLELNNVCRKMHAHLLELRRFRVGGHKDAPVKHLYLRQSSECVTNDEKLLRDITAEVSPLHSIRIINLVLISTLISTWVWLDIKIHFYWYYYISNNNYQIYQH